MTYREFTAAVRVYLVPHNRRQGIQVLLDQLIRAGCIDLQSGIPEYKNGHVSEFGEADLTVDGYASLGPLPNGVVTSAVLVTRDATTGALDETEVLPLKRVSWGAWQDMRAGTVASNVGLIALDARASLFLVTPIVSNTSTLRITWTGIKYDFQPTDRVQYSDTAVQAVSEYIMARLTRLIDKNMTIAASHEKTYIQLKRRIRSECRAQGGITQESG